MNTPNPNPSPELIDEMMHEIWDAAPIRTHAEARDLANTLAALSPQTLPAPGEVGVRERIAVLERENLNYAKTMEIIGQLK